ncbi:MAG: acetyl-CoA carboxylase carboxyltransferase subunit beta [Candidatus Omnitrophica bacterium]|nr:acetyl-CoA carboxylase carboxyltransferase subunit beta [Candidatus Omnitrophota bacterium]
MSLFSRRPKYAKIQIKKKQIPGGLWTKCENCGAIIYNKTLQENLVVCPKCDYHFKLSARQRIDLLFDKGSFIEHDKEMESLDPLRFEGPRSYKDKLKEAKDQTALKEAAVCGEAKIEGERVMFAVTDSRFIMGSMGSVVGEKITRVTEEATKKKLPLIIISGSGGGARMYEGMFSLMQMAKTSAAISRHQKAGLLYISLLTNPSMAGIMASFASLGDVIIAEPRALIGFTGPRVIEQTIKQKLPEGFQSSEFLLKHGLVDMIVDRKELKSTLYKLIGYLS